MSKSCTLLTSDDAVHNDMKASLKLLEMDLHVVTEAEKVQEQLEAARPELLFVHSDLAMLSSQVSSSQAIELARQIKSDKALQTIPIILLRDGEEPSYEETGFFEGALLLPVEFPTVTQHIRSLLEQFKKSPLKSLDYDFSGPDFKVDHLKRQADVVPSKSPEVPSDPLKQQLLDRKVLIAYGVIGPIMERLKSDTRFQSCALADIPSVFSEIASEVCRDLDIDNIFKN